MINALTVPGIRFAYAGCFVREEDWIHPDRVEETYELICVTRGVVHLHDACFGEVAAGEGQVLLLEPGCRHYGTKHSAHVRFYWVHFHLQQGQLPFAQRVFTGFEQGPLFRELLHLANLPQPPAYAVDAVLNHILCELCRLSEQTVRYDRRAEEIGEWIRIHACAGLRAADVAAQFGFSEDHLTRILQKTYGCGVKELTARFVTARARELLCNTNLYVKQVAAALGFSGDKAFIAFFKYHEGLSPARFRDRFSRTHMNNR